MDEWRQRLFGEIVPEASRPSTAHSASTALEIALGHARSEVAYVLELGRAHKLPTAGGVNGDDVWLVIGNARLEFAYDRRKGVITASVPGRGDTRVTFDEATRDLVTRSGEEAGAFDARAFVRSAIDATVAAWKAAPVSSPRPRWDSTPRPPPALEEAKKPEG